MATGKPAGGAMIGVTIPIAVEYVAKGKRLGEKVKISGILGLVEGGVGLGGAIGSEKGLFLRGMKDEDKAFLAAFGGAGLATGASILILDELRKRALYEFKTGKKAPSKLPLTEFPRMEEETPTAELVEEI